MRKLVGLLAVAAAAVVLVAMTTGCAHTAGFSAAQVSASYNTRAHAWEPPHFTADFEGNPVKSEWGTGFVTVGSQAGFADHSEGKWFTFDTSVGPK